jgi:hypothetical protein
MVALKTREPMWAVSRFVTLGGDPVLELAWGDAIRGLPSRLGAGVWIRLGAVPVLPPWQAPTTWGELRAACSNQGVDLDALMSKAASGCRDDRARPLFVGFPIPERVGGQPTRMHWQALQLPVLARTGTKVPGFRPSERACWVRDRTGVLSDTAAVDWLNSENWHMDEVQSRGRLPEVVREREVLLVGAGALGAPIAQLLMRAGATTQVVVDDDRLEVGNLVRHTLGTDDLKTGKASALAQQLRSQSPHACVTAVLARFPELKPDDLTRAARCNLVLDCTAEDEVIPALSAFAWELEDTVVFSMSLSLGARRLFCYSAHPTEFREANFRSSMEPWLVEQRKQFAEAEMPREGVGCWHPVFPARVDDIWMLAAAAVKEIERALTCGVFGPRLVVYEMTTDEGGWFSGVRRFVPGEQT